LIVCLNEFQQGGNCFCRLLFPYCKFNLIFSYSRHPSLLPHIPSPVPASTVIFDSWHTVIPGVVLHPSLYLSTSLCNTFSINLGHFASFFRSFLCFQREVIASPPPSPPLLQCWSRSSSFTPNRPFFLSHFLSHAYFFSYPVVLPVGTWTSVTCSDAIPFTRLGLNCSFNGVSAPHISRPPLALFPSKPPLL